MKNSYPGREVITGKKISLVVNEIFYSIEGESARAGFPAVFIRLAGCNLRCSCCDTEYARGISAGMEMSMADIIGKIRGIKSADHVTITGGEPLCQDECAALAAALIEAGFRVQVETNGSLPVSVLPQGARKIIDVKTPSSGECGSFLMENLKYAGARDELKFVISDAGDYDFSKDFITQNRKLIKSAINFSPAEGAMKYSELADNILKDRLPARLNLQLHKIIWREEGKVPL